jgi:hypothetical protein
MSSTWRCARCRRWYPADGDDGRGAWLYPRWNLSCIAVPLCKACALPVARLGRLGAGPIRDVRAIFARRGRARR